MPYQNRVSVILFDLKFNLTANIHPRNQQLSIIVMTQKVITNLEYNHASATQNFIATIIFLVVGKDL